MNLRAGTLNRRITIQRRDTGTDAAGQPLQTWTDVATVWANITGQTGMGSIRNGVASSDGLTAAAKHYSVRIRFRTGLDEGMRVVYAGQNFDVREVRMDYSGREWTDLVCVVGTSDG